MGVGVGLGAEREVNRRDQIPGPLACLQLPLGTWRVPLTGEGDTMSWSLRTFGAHLSTPRSPPRLRSYSRPQSGSGPSSSCVWNPRVFADDARGWQCPFLLCLHPQACLRRGVRAKSSPGRVWARVWTHISCLLHWQAGSTATWEAFPKEVLPEGP